VLDNSFLFVTLQIGKKRVDVNLKSLIKGGISFFLPADCLICGKSLEPLNRSFICGYCWGKVKWLTPPYCSICGRPLPSEYDCSDNSSFLCGECQVHPPYFKKAFIPTLYQGVMKEAIKLFKYKGKIGISRGLTKITRIYFDHSRFSLPELDLVIPIPLHRRKLKERGFNQAEIIAKFIAEYLNLNLVGDGLIRVRFTNSQTQLKREERLTNIKGAFKIKREERFKRKRVLLVDDVYTTGVTLNEAAKEIKKTKAEVYVFALARTP